MEKKLTLKEQRLIRGYLKTGNKTQSAIAAGYSKKTARSIAYETLTKPHIQLKMEAIMSEEAKKLGLDAEYVLNKLKNFAEKENEKIAPTVLKAIELIGRHLKLFHENEKVMDVRLSEHRAIIEELAKDD